MKLPWYVKSFYDKEKDCYFLKVNKWWALWSLFKYYLFMRWIKKHSYPYNWHTLTSDIEVKSGVQYWSTPNAIDMESWTNAK